MIRSQLLPIDRYVRRFHTAFSKPHNRHNKLNIKTYNLFDDEKKLVFRNIRRSIFTPLVWFFFLLFFQYLLTEFTRGGKKIDWFNFFFVSNVHCVFSVVVVFFVCLFGRVCVVLIGNRKRDDLLIIDFSRVASSFTFWRLDGVCGRFRNGKRQKQKMGSSVGRRT